MSRVERTHQTNPAGYPVWTTCHPDGDGPVEWCLVAANTSKWLIVLAGRYAFPEHGPESHVVYADKVIVWALNRWKSLALLQSCVHVAWARFSGNHSTMQTTPRYNISTIWRTFPMPRPSEAQLEALESIGLAYHRERASIQRDFQLGATKLYNRLADPKEKDPRILAFRVLHAQMDRLVLDCYGWTDISAPCLTTVPSCREVGAAPPEIAEIERRLRALSLQRARGL